MPAQDFDPESKFDIADDIEFISENHLIHVEVDSEDDNDTVEMEFESENESENESPETNEFPIFDMSNLIFITRFYRIIACLENILCAMRRCLNTYPPESVIGSSLRNCNMNFLTSWRFIFEKIHLFFGAMMFNYYIKLIPTVIERMDGYFFYTNQFSVTKFEKHLSITEGDSGMPGIFFSYELSPLMVKRVEQQKSLSHLIMTVLSYISGVYIAALLVDSFVHKTVKYVQKLEIGKQS